MFQFSKATKDDAKLQLALIGPSGSGKTYTALALATSLADRVAVIDTEHGSASKYADLFNFDVLSFDDFHPQNFIDAINAAAKAGYGAVIIDSLSHAWNGKGGALELVDRAKAASRGNSSFNAWASVTPLQTAMVQAIVSAPLHIISTMRAKTEYVVENKAPRIVGTAPIQREGIEYEFDMVAYLDQENNFIVTKTRCSELHGQVFKRAGADVAEILKKWLHGKPVELASAEEIAHANEIRLAAIKWGYLTDSGAEPKEVVPEIPLRTLAARREKWTFFIDAAEADAAREKAAPAAPNPPESSTPATAPAAPREGGDFLTDAQHRAVLAIANRVFGRPASADDFAEYIDKPLEELTKNEASALIDRLRFRLAETQAAAPPNPKSEPRNAARRPARSVEHESGYARS